MKRILFVYLLLIAFVKAGAQDAAVKEMKSTTTSAVKIADTARDKNGWIKGALFSLNLTQVGNSNWIAAGGDQFSLSVASALNAFATKAWGRKTWVNVLDVNYALLNTTTLGVRKVNDRLDFLTKLTSQPKKWEKVSFATLAQLRTQVTSGFDYEYFGTTIKRRNSGFFAPAYVTIAPLGLEWKPNDFFSVFVSPIVAKWTIVTNRPYSYVSQGGYFNGKQETPLATLYGVDPEKQNRGEFGAFLTATFKNDIMKNVNYYSKIDLYSNYLKNPQNVDIFWTNQFKMKVNKWIQVSYTLDMLYDDDVKQEQTDPLVAPKSVGLQLLSTLGVGFAYKF